MSWLTKLLDWFSALFNKKASIETQRHETKDGWSEFGDAAKSSDLAELQAAQDKMLADNPQSSDPATNAINAAAKILVSGDFPAAIVAWQQVADTYPDERGDAYSQIGVAHFFLGDYAKAIEYYKLAGEHGADASMIAENIEEAEGELAK